MNFLVHFEDSMASNSSPKFRVAIVYVESTRSVLSDGIADLSRMHSGAGLGGLLFALFLQKHAQDVEVDIYDGPTPSSEPLIFHGKTLVSKVPLRSVCAAIAKYGFVASPYPLIISAEMHCSVLGQVQVARVMIEEFGDTLVRVPLEDVPEDGWKVDHLPSPEELRGKILLKSKNVYVGRDRNPDAPPELELTSTTTSESDFLEAAGISEYASTVKGEPFFKKSRSMR